MLHKLNRRLLMVSMALALTILGSGVTYAASLVASVSGPSSVARWAYADYYTAVDYSTDFWGYTGYFYSWYPRNLFEQPWKIGGNVSGNGFYLGTNAIKGGSAWEYSASFGLPWDSSRYDFLSRARANTTGGGWYTGGTGTGHQYDSNKHIWVNVY